MGFIFSETSYIFTDVPVIAWTYPQLQHRHINSFQNTSYCLSLSGTFLGHVLYPCLVEFDTTTINLSTTMVSWYIINLLYQKAFWHQQPFLTEHISYRHMYELIQSNCPQYLLFIEIYMHKWTHRLTVRIFNPSTKQTKPNLYDLNTNSLRLCMLLYKAFVPDSFLNQTVEYISSRSLLSQ